jgi:CO/xanthine dehydrogenase FAD-binding subunit
MASTPLLVHGLDFARDQTLDDWLLAKIFEVVDQQIQPFSDIRGSEWYKRQLCRVFVKRAIAELDSRGHN